MKNIAIAATCCLTAIFAAPAYSEPIVGGQTNVQVTFDTAGAGITPGITGTSTIVSADPLTLGFGISGGDLDFTTLIGTIEHDGVGVSLTGDLGTADTMDDVTILLSNFVINTATSILSGDVDIGDDGVDVSGADLFSFDLTGLDEAAITDLTTPQIPLSFTQIASDVLVANFQLGTATSLTGVQFGLAATAPIADDPTVTVSEPATTAMFGAGLIGFAVSRRRRLD